jgi:hypothetical protein
MIRQPKEEQTNGLDDSFRSSSEQEDEFLETEFIISEHVEEMDGSVSEMEREIDLANDRKLTMVN